MAEHTEEALAARLVETYSDRLLRLAYSILNSVPDAQDVCQEVLLKRLEYPGACCAARRSLRRRSMKRPGSSG